MSNIPTSKRRQRIMIYSILIFAVLPAALALLFLVSGFAFAITGVLVYFYVLAIAGVTIILFEQLAKELRTRP